MTQSLLATVVPNSLRRAAPAQASSLFVSLDDQVRELCDVLGRDSRCAASTSSRTRRARSSRAASSSGVTPPVHSFVAAGPHAGQFGLPFYAPPERDSPRAAGLAAPPTWRAAASTRRRCSRACSRSTGATCSTRARTRAPPSSPTSTTRAPAAPTRRTGGDRRAHPQPRLRARRGGAARVVSLRLLRAQLVGVIRLLRRSPLHTRDLLGLAELDARALQRRGPIATHGLIRDFPAQPRAPVPQQHAAAAARRRRRPRLPHPREGLTSLQARFDI